VYAGLALVGSDIYLSIEQVWPVREEVSDKETEEEEEEEEEEELLLPDAEEL
jgi:hypothetical protein